MATRVLVFDGRPEPVAKVDPNPKFNFPLTQTKGRRGAQGDQNVVVLEHDEPIPDDLPAGKIIYRLLEES